MYMFVENVYRGIYCRIRTLSSHTGPYRVEKNEERVFLCVFHIRDIYTYILICRYLYMTYINICIYTLHQNTLLVLLRSIESGPKSRGEVSFKDWKMLV